MDKDVSEKINRLALPTWETGNILEVVCERLSFAMNDNDCNGSTVENGQMVVFVAFYNSSHSEVPKGVFDLKTSDLEDTVVYKCLTKNGVGWREVFWFENEFLKKVNQ